MPLGDDQPVGRPGGSVQPTTQDRASVRGSGPPLIPLPRAAGRSSRCTKVAMAIRRARHLARVDAAEFARLLRTRLEREGDMLAPTDVTAWEDGLDVPSAVALLVAAEVAGVELEVLFCRRPVLARLSELEEQVRRQSLQLRDLLHRVS
jgi:transcriptional regulator with XRE-family HTH domain